MWRSYLSTCELQVLLQQGHGVWCHHVALSFIVLSWKQINRSVSSINDHQSSIIDQRSSIIHLCGSTDQPRFSGSHLVCGTWVLLLSAAPSETFPPLRRHHLNKPDTWPHRHVRVKNTSTIHRSPPPPSPPPHRSPPPPPSSSSSRYFLQLLLLEPETESTNEIQPWLIIGHQRPRDQWSSNLSAVPPFCW